MDEVYRPHSLSHLRSATAYLRANFVQATDVSVSAATSVIRFLSNNLLKKGRDFLFIIYSIGLKYLNPVILETPHCIVDNVTRS